jgi:heptosyltransferase-1
MGGLRILAVRLGALGDIVHALPAVATLKHSFPHCRLSWAVEPKWTALLEANPFLDDLIVCSRHSLRAMVDTRRRLRREHFDVAVDFQGLIKSALLANSARPEKIFGYHASQVRERLAALFYSHKVRATASHIVDRHLELVAAAGASSIVKAFPLPRGKPEGKLPAGRFVLASPLAGWAAKQWPLEYYSRLGKMLRERWGVALVLNGPPTAEQTLRGVGHTETHISAVDGLIDATRRAAAVIGVDSGPMHLAAALERPGVAIFGPTDPQRNGPYGTSLAVLRSHRALTSYKRRQEIDESMREITPEQVLEVLMERLEQAARSAGRSL